MWYCKIELSTHLISFSYFSTFTYFSIHTLDADWVEEFVDITDEDVEATFNQQQDFWSKMENEWKEMAEKNKETGEHPWLDDFEEVWSLTSIMLIKLLGIC